MDRSQILKIVVVLSSLIFIFQLFPIGSFFIGSPSSQKNLSTSVSFNATLKNYDPYLILSQNSTGTVSINELEALPLVKSVSSEGGFIYVLLETRDDVRPVASNLQTLGLFPSAIANLVPPDRFLVLDSKSQSVNISTPFAIRIAIAPYFAEDSQIPVDAILIHTDRTAVGFSSPTLIATPKNISGSLLVSKILSSQMTYSIPFENRSSSNFSAIENSTYSLNNLVTSSSAFTPNQISTARSLDYVVGVYPTYLALKPDFTDLDRLRSDLAISAFSVHPSLLVVNSSVALDIPYSSSTSSKYELSPSSTLSGKQVINSVPLIFVSSNSYLVNDSLNGTISILEIGDYLIPLDFSMQ